jgi:hypothetical protein
MPRKLDPPPIREIPGESQYDRFVRVASAIIAVPKSEITMATDAKMKQKAAVRAAREKVKALKEKKTEPKG